MGVWGDIYAQQQRPQAPTGGYQSGGGGYQNAPAPPTNTYTPPPGAQFIPSQGTDNQSQYMGNYEAGGTIDALLGPPPAGYKWMADGSLRKISALERYSESPLALTATAFGAGIGLPALLGSGAAGAGGAATLPNLAAPGSSVYSGLAAAGAPSITGAGVGAGTGLAGAVGGAGGPALTMTPEGALLPAGQGAVDVTGVGAAGGAGTAADVAPAALTNAAAPGSATYSGLTAGGTTFPGSAAPAAAGGGMGVWGTIKKNLPIIGPIAQAGIEAFTAKKAANQQVQGAERAMDIQNRVYQQQQQLMQPYYETGTEAFQTLGGLMGLGGAPVKMPMYGGGVGGPVGPAPAAPIATPAPPQQSTGKLVTMVAPDGSRGNVPEEHVRHYEELGARLAQSSYGVRS